jgi:hypothetical protein
MIRDRSERRLYRKSPGRQYGYEYDPLRSQSLPTGNSQQGQSDASVQSESWSARQETGIRTGRQTSGLLAPRPDPRRTRQLIRQSIIANKSKSALLDDTGQLDPELRGRYALSGEDQGMYESEVDTTLYAYRRPHSAQLVSPAQQRSIDVDEGYEDGPWPEEGLDYLDPDLGYDVEEDLLARRLTSTESPRVKSAGLRMQPETPERGRRRSAPLEYDEDEQDEVAAGRRKKKGISRRKLLLGAAVVGGTAIAGYELIPRLPQALEQAGTNIEHQLQDAFNKGLAAGEQAVRKEFINTLDTLEGVSLEGAIGAARLTRVAYDVFVSPLVTLAATVANDFLSVTLAALIKARSWLTQINADNATLAALQAVLQNWTDQAHNMPKKLQTITETDLDGAQAYLRALQRKIQEEQAKLNGQSTTPTPAPTSTPKHS